MNKSAYWHQKASPWVSFTVLFGGLISACLLLFTYKVQTDFQAMEDTQSAFFSQFED